jgi:VanZ family protein
MGSATGLLTRGSLLRRLPGSRQWLRGGGASPLTAAGPSRTRTGFPHRAPGSRASLSSETVSDTGPRNDAGLRPVGVRHRSIRLWLPVVLWAALIFGFSSVPDLGTGLGGWDLVLRKIAHAAEYAVLGALLARALASPRIAALAGMLYAVSDEVHQAFVSGRHGSPIDVAIDAVGVVAGVVLWERATRARRLA